MAYTWTNGELITAEKLNQTGGGGGVFITSYSDGRLGNTWQEIHDAYTSGMTVLVLWENIDPITGTYTQYQTVITVSSQYIGASDYNPEYMVSCGRDSYFTDSADGYPHIND